MLGVSKSPKLPSDTTSVAKKNMFPTVKHKVGFVMFWDILHQNLSAPAKKAQVTLHKKYFGHNNHSLNIPFIFLLFALYF